MKGEVQLEPPGIIRASDSDPLLENQEDGAFRSSSSEIKVDGDTEGEVEAGLLPCCRICLESESELAVLQTFSVDNVQGTHSCVEYSLNAPLVLSVTEDELITPCMCKGTQQFVHRSCLDHWRSVKEGFAFSHCTTCKAQFHLRIAMYEDNSWRKIKFRLFVARDVFLVFLAVQTFIAVLGGSIYVMDKDGTFRNSFSDGWDRILSKHPIPFYYCIGVLLFFVVIGFFGLLFHCSSMSTIDPRLAGCQNCCYGWGILDCFPASMEACFALVIVFIVIFAVLGIAYGFLAATMGIQRIWQKHYHILTKRELTKEYIVEDLHGCYSPPKLDPEHEQRLKLLRLL